MSFVSGGQLDDKSLAADGIYSNSPELVTVVSGYGHKIRSNFY
ncbi:hypothetical protein XSR1_370006 [Xenorhabdus szentirmaii DSM 16338]|uniref:Uncharacterized protein n=1 Tax=Xenorhabdus szentirmaii DSM 16338 TaxID=1427518 RepID=W1J128_9GAMM|nr:hypothetical protein XSR1_370006 [Xenorhabdus szentirmaii DSM 16338]